MAAIAFLTALVLLAAHAGAQPMPPHCVAASDACRFTFDGVTGLPTYALTAQSNDVAFTTRIVSKNDSVHIGIVNSNDVIPQFIFATAESNISLWGQPKLSPTHFKPYTIANTSYSGIGHQYFTGNQFATARGNCIRVYFASYQVLNAGGNVVRNVHHTPSGAKSMGCCVVFRIKG